MIRTRVWLALAGLGLIGFGSSHILAGSHTWDVNELFSNADGTIQFIELKETGGGDGEVGVGGHHVTSNAKDFIIPSNVAPPTGFKHLLLATATFAALPGAPTPDHIIPSNFFSVGADRIEYVPWDFLIFGSGQLPTDGLLSLNANLTTSTNSPTNYAGQTGSVNANPPAPPGVPDGKAGTMPMTVTPLDTAGTSLSISWDTASCSGASDHFIVYGQGSQLPSVPGGAFGLTGSVCGMGASSPFVWNPSPTASDGTGLIWWLVLVKSGGGIEGSWGKGTDLLERRGPGVGGSSGQCGIMSKNISNTCGQ